MQLFIEVLANEISSLIPYEELIQVIWQFGTGTIGQWHDQQQDIASQVLMQTTKFNKVNVGFHTLPDVMTRDFTHDTFGKKNQIHNSYPAKNVA